MPLARMKNRVVALAVLVEIAYVLITRLLLRGSFSGVDLEISKTVVRLLCAAVYWVILQRSLDVESSRFQASHSALAFLGVAILLLVPVVAHDTSSAPHSAIRIVFALTSIAVAMREEFFYRGILQRWLGDRVGMVPAIIYSNLAFTLYHLGNQSLVQAFVVGGLLGLVYAGTRSLLTVVIVHATYDALWALSPFLLNAVEEPWLTCMLLSSLALVSVWFIFVSRVASGRAEWKGSHAG